MDPASALGLASAVVAIVDFSWKLLTGAREIHKSMEGGTAENTHLEDVMGHLESLMQVLTADVPVKTTAERNILHLAEECKKDAKALMDLLMELKVPGRRQSLWESLKAKWKSVMKKREVAQLKIRLQESRADIQVNIISMLKEEQSNIGLQLTKIEQDCNDFKTGWSSQLNGLKAELLNSMGQHATTIQQQLQDMQRSISTISMQHRILRHLLPDETRKGQILEADPETCRWILEPGIPQARDVQNYRQEIHEDFIRWLRTGIDVLHFSGNPGSGKSTLMKFIAGNLRTQKELRAWAGNKQLIFAQFYFWTAGTKAQRTLLGMLQSLLFQVLSQHPDLIEAVFPNQLNRLRTSQSQSDYGMEKSQYFNSEKIQEAFDLFLSHIANSEYKAFFLIDGLDEHEGNDLDHESLAERLKFWTTGGEIKLLVSSRPWRPFLTTFTTQRTFHLHELNHDDIKTYAINRLRKDKRIHSKGVDSITMTMTTTISLIVEKLSRQAQGIFLWAHLVLSVIQQDLRRSYTLPLLMAKIQEYPSDLDGLYDALRGPIEKSPIDRSLSNRMLLLASAAPEGFPLYVLAFSWLPDDDRSGLLDPNFPHTTNCRQYSKQDLEERLQCVVERMDGLTRGLLELGKPAHPQHASTMTVWFCHRTAREYLTTNDERNSALKKSWPNFHQSDPYGRIYLANLIYNRDCAGVDYLWPEFCCNFKFETLRKFEKPMQPFMDHFFGFDEVHRYYRNHETAARFNFLRYAAFSGLDSFALEEALSYFGAFPHPPEIVFLLAASFYPSSGLGGGPYGSGRFQFASGLLERCLSKDIIGVVDAYPVDRSTKLPVWIIAFMIGLDDILHFCHLRSSKWELDRERISPSRVKLCRLLNDLALKLGQRLFVTVAVEKPSPGQLGKVTSFFDSSKRTFSAARLLEWVERAALGFANLPESDVLEGESNELLLDKGDTIREESLPTSHGSCQIASWNLALPSGSIEGATRIGTEHFLNLE